MQVMPLTIHDLLTTSTYELELARENVTEKICYLAISYFCISTELRFLSLKKEETEPERIKKES